MASRPLKTKMPFSTLFRYFLFATAILITPYFGGGVSDTTSTSLAIGACFFILFSISKPIFITIKNIIYNTTSFPHH